MGDRDTFELLLDELVNYYNADVLPSPAASLTADDFRRSARRLVAFHGQRAEDVADLLMQLSGDASNPLFVKIESSTLYHWNGTPEDWETFRRMATRIATDVEALLVEVR